jgi:hypothetical protein
VALDVVGQTAAHVVDGGDVILAPLHATPHTQSSLITAATTIECTCMHLS